MMTRSRKADQQPAETLPKLFDRLPPSCPEAEMSLLGAMIIAGGVNVHIIGQIIQLVQADDFQQPRHQVLYRLMTDLYDQRQAIDNVQLLSMLRERELLDKVGGTDYVIQLAESVPIAENAPYYAKIVRDTARRRQLIASATRVLRDAYTSTDSADDQLDRAQADLWRLADRDTTGADRNLVTVNQAFTASYEQLDARHEDGTALTGLDTGFHELNDMTNGLQPTDLIIVGARSSMGKTAFALSIAEHVAFDLRQPVLLFSLEMGQQQLAQRMMASRSGVDGQRMRRNMLNADEIHRLQEVKDESHEAPLLIDTSAALSVIQVRSRARRLTAERGIKLIVVDYLQLMKYPDAESRQQEVSMIAAGLKNLAKELNLPVLALAQLNRNPEGRRDNRPLLSDLRESGDLENHSDVVMLLYREEYYHKAPSWAVENPEKVGLTEIIIAKQRNGPTGVVPLHFNSRTTHFENRHHHGWPVQDAAQKVTQEYIPF